MRRILHNISGIALILSIILLVSCQNKPKSDATADKIPFTVVKKHFIKNNADALDNPKIESREKFDAIFGTAATMGKDGIPTQINFSKQYVIALIEPETDYSIRIEPVSLQKNEKGEIVFSYKIVKGEKQSYTIIPFSAISVDNSYSGNIVLHEIKE